VSRQALPLTCDRLEVALIYLIGPRFATLKQMVEQLTPMHKPNIMPHLKSLRWFLAVLVSTAIFAPLGFAQEASPGDWVYWRGPQFSGHSTAKGLPDDWDPDGGEGSNLLWKRDDLGTRSTPIVMNGKLYTLTRAEPETKREGEKVVCLDLQTGETIWENRFNVWLSDVPDTRVGWSSVVGDPETGNVYALGVAGFFQCINGETGKTVWSVPMHERFGLLSTYGGRTNFPIVVDDVVIISAVVIGWGEMAKPAHRFIAFEKNTGEVRWFTSTRLLPDDTTYSAPVVATIEGQKLLIFGSGDGAVWAFQPRTGRRVWQYKLSMRGLNVSPTVVGNTVYTSQSEENLDSTAMGALVAIDASGTGDITQSGQKWKIPEVMAGKASVLHIDDTLYVFDDRAKLYTYDAETGEQIYRKALGTVMRASPLYADGKIYALENGGRWYILKPTEDGEVEVVSNGRLDRGEGVDASPIAADGKVIITSTGAIYCLSDPSKKHGADPIPPMPEETPVADDPKPAYLQVVPAEALIRPEEALSFTARLYNANGQFLKETPAEFSVEGVGSISAEGNYDASQVDIHGAAYVTAKAEGLSGKARLRVVPSLPWSFDFESTALDGPGKSGEPPVTWVGARYRHVVREVDGNKVMVKVTTIPKGTRSRCWFGHSDLSNYTMQADVRGAITNDKMPDIGIIAQGYCMDMQGASQRLQLRSWVPQLRMATTIDFKWKPDTWYTMKLQASQEDEKVVLRGKVWPRGEDEPEQWTITAEDEAPVTQGSPGLYGNAKDAELYLDNIQVTENQ
jgi:outer membrane protein assembly factor BamB